MALYTRNLIADIVDETVDNNAKLIDGAGPPIVQLAPDADEFGDSFDNWDEISGSDIRTGSYAKGTAEWREAGGILDVINEPAGDYELVARRNNVTYLDGDVCVYLPQTDYSNQTYLGIIDFWLWRIKDTGVFIRYIPRRQAGMHLIQVYKIINTVPTKLFESANIIAPALWLRIKRVTGVGTQTFTFYYATADPYVLPANWAQVWTGVVYDATHLTENHLLYVLINSYVFGVGVFDPQYSFYRQWTGDMAAQRFWPDSPECHIINSAAGAVEYAFDATAGNAWHLAGAAAGRSEPGASTVLFKVGYSDTGLDADVTWVDIAWQTSIQVSINAAAGLYDNHRYLHVKAQFNSDGTVQPSLTDFTINGTQDPVFIPVAIPRRGAFC